MSQPKGGTELLFEGLVKGLAKEDLEGVNIIVNNLGGDLVSKDKINILWNHHSYDQPAVKSYEEKHVLDGFQGFVYVSHWQYEKYRKNFDIPEERSYVLRNAISPIDIKEKSGKIRLIYTSTPWRGLDVLLDAFCILDRDDVELDVYSSTIIYGADFYRQFDSQFTELFERARKTANVNYHGYASNAEVREALSRSHIFAYPSTWEETSCLSAIEAGMAGLQIVTTNLGALYETVNVWGKLVAYDADRKRLAKKYANVLSEAIDQYWSPENQNRLHEQHCFYKRFYSWEARILEWRDLLRKIKLKEGWA